MLEYTSTVNKVWSFQAPFELLIAKRYPGASLALYDVHSLLTDIYNNPTQYLESPANVTGFYHKCNSKGADCVNSTEPIGSFLWYDALHPSAKADEIIAKNFVDLVNGNSKYATYW
jgi:phospholipase/lecithinase/hemolysin